MNQNWTKILPHFIRTRLEGRYNLQKIIGNTGWLFADKLLSLVSGLLIGVWVARHLGPHQYGVYNYALAFVALITPLVSLGLPGILVRNIVRNPKSKDQILGTAFAMQLISSSLAFFLVVGVIRVVRPNDCLVQVLVTIVAIRLLVMPLSTTFEYWFKSQMQAKHFVVASKIALVVIALVKIGLIFANASVEAFAWAFIAEVVLVTGLMLIFYWSSGNSLRRWRIRVKEAEMLLRDSWPLILSGFAIVIYMKIDQIMLGQMIGETELGYYSAAVRLSELWIFIPSIVMASVLPTIVQSRENQDVQIYQARMQMLYDMLAGASYLVVILILIFGSNLVRILYGSDYAAAGAILIVHIFSIVFVSLGMARDNWLIVENLVVHITAITVAGMLINIALNYLFIPLYGGVGAAWATVVSQVFVAYLSCLVFKPLRPVFVQLSRSLIIPLRIFSLKHYLSKVF